MSNANGDLNNGPSPFVPNRRIITTTTLDGTAAATEPLYPDHGPDPTGTNPAEVAQTRPSTEAVEKHGAGVEGEDVVWEARYSMKNFIGRLIFRGVLTIAVIALAAYTWGFSNGALAVPTYVAAAVVLILWAALLYRMAQAHYGHYYRLTNRRLFISSGLMRRQRDQLELLHVKDVQTRQTLVERWLSLGTVVVVSDQRQPGTLGVVHLPGVADPKLVMDLVWHHARAERDNRSTKIDSV